MEPSRDLRGITDLIEEAFADNIDERGKAALREMRWMARLSPLVWWWSQADPAFREAFQGLVWEAPSPPGKRGDIVGNVNLTRAPGSLHYWVICNVVVDTEYRGQGIGHKLVGAAVSQARALGAVGIILQVDAENVPALRIYTDHGFREVIRESTLHLDKIESVALLEAPGYRIRPWQPSNGQATYSLAQRAIPQALQWLRPIRPAQYKLTWWDRLSRHLESIWSGRREYRLLALEQGRLAAMLSVTVSFRENQHQLALLVDPSHRGRIEAALLSRALHMLSAIPTRPASITVHTDQVAALRALRNYGFRQGQTMLTLQKNLP
jgi:ribosomal protein S18 acetylase RimI-like enzyme